ncbi:Uncharacterised protein [Mycobacteroides abscessus subsp. abscessus]|nr:Uncharacterised protein [Mycobacteroides abscessus subsp. abscessus]
MQRSVLSSVLGHVRQCCHRSGQPSAQASALRRVGSAQERQELILRNNLSSENLKDRRLRIA